MSDITGEGLKVIRDEEGNQVGVGLAGSDEEFTPARTPLDVLSLDDPNQVDTIQWSARSALGALARNGFQVLPVERVIDYEEPEEGDPEFMPGYHGLDNDRFKSYEVPADDI